MGEQAPYKAAPPAATGHFLANPSAQPGAFSVFICAYPSGPGFRVLGLSNRHGPLLLDFSPIPGLQIYFFLSGVSLFDVGTWNAGRP